MLGSNVSNLGIWAASFGCFPVYKLKLILLVPFSSFSSHFSFMCNEIDPRVVSALGLNRRMILPSPAAVGGFPFFTSGWREPC